MGRFVGYLVALVTAIANWYVFKWYASLFPHSYSDEFIATVFIVSLVVHELFHLVAMEINGIKAMMFFAVILGGAMPLSSDIEKMSGLPWDRRASIFLAGVAGNMVVAFGAWVVYLLGGISFDQMISVFKFSGVFILFNLIPFGRFDGGQFVKLLFSSSPEEQNGVYVLALMAGVLVLWSTLSFVSGNMIFLTVFLGGMPYQAHSHKYTTAVNFSSIDPRRLLWIGVYLILTMAGAMTFGFSVNLPY